MPTCPPPRSTPEPTPKPNAKPSKAPTSHSPLSPCLTGQQTKISSHGSTASASNTIGLCGRNQHARLCYQRRCYYRPHNPAIHIMPQDMGRDVLGGDPGACRGCCGGVDLDALRDGVGAHLPDGAAGGEHEAAGSGGVLAVPLAQ